MIDSGPEFIVPEAHVMYQAVLNAHLSYGITLSSDDFGLLTVVRRYLENDVELPDDLLLRLGGLWAEATHEINRRKKNKPNSGGASG